MNIIEKKGEWMPDALPPVNPERPQAQTPPMPPATPPQVVPEQPAPVTEMPQPQGATEGSGKDKPKKKRSCLGCLWRSAVVGVVLLLLLVLLAPYLIPTDSLRRMIVTAVKEQTNRPCSLASLQINLYAGGVVAEGFVIESNDPDAPPLCKIDRAVVAIDLASLPALLDGKAAKIKSITLSGGAIALRRSVDGTLNIDDLIGADGTQTPTAAAVPVATPANPTPWPVIPEQITITDVAFLYRDVQQDIDTRVRFANLSATIDDVNAPIALQARLEIDEGENRAGGLELDGSIDLFENYALQAPDGTAAVKLDNVNLHDLLIIAGQPQPTVHQGQADGTLQIALRAGTPQITGTLTSGPLALNLPNRPTPVTFPEMSLTLDVTVDPATQGCKFKTVTIGSPLGDIHLRDGSLSLSTQPSQPIPVQAKATLEADLSLETIGDFVKENKFAILPADMEGRLKLSGPLTMLPDDLVMNLTLQSDRIRVSGPNFTNPMELNIGSKVAYSYKNDRLTMPQFQGSTEGATIRATLDATGLWRSERSLNMQVNGTGNLKTLGERFHLASYTDGLGLRGNAVLNLTAKTDATRLIHLVGTLQAPEGGRIYIDTPAPINAPVDLGQASVKLDASFRPGPKPEDNVVTLNALQIATLPVSGGFRGRYNPTQGSWALSYACRALPGKARAILAKLAPYDLGEFIRMVEFRGLASYSTANNTFTFKQASAKGSLALDQEQYTFEIFHDGTFAPSDMKFDTERLMMQVLHKQKPVCEALLALHGTHLLTTPTGEVNFNLSGDLNVLRNIGIRFLPLPRTLHPHGSVTVTGLFRRNNERIDGEIDGTLRNLNAVSDYGWQIREPSIKTIMRFSYTEANQTFIIKRHDIENEVGDIKLSMQGGMVLRAGGQPNRQADWTLEPQTRVSCYIDSAILKRILKTKGEDMQLPQGIVQAMITPRGTLDTPRIAANVKLEQLRIPGTSKRFPTSVQILSDLQVGHGTAQSPLLDLLDLQVSSLPGFTCRVRGKLQHMRTLQDGRIDFGPQTVIAFRANSDRTLLATLTNQPVPTDTGTLQSVLVQGRAAIPGLLAGTQPVWQRAVRLAKVDAGQIAVDLLRADNRNYKDIRATYRVDKGVLYIEKAHVNFGGPVFAQATINMNPDLPACELRYRSPGVNISESVEKIGEFTLFTDGTIIAPYPDNGQESSFQWQGFSKESFDNTLRIPRTTLMVKDFKLFTRKEETDWNRMVRRRLPEDLAAEVIRQVERHKDKFQETSDSFLTKEVAYKTFFVDYEVRERVLYIHDVRIEGGNTADFAVQGRIGFDKSLRLNVMPIGNMDRTLQTQTILANKEVAAVMAKIPEPQRTQFARLIPDWVEDKARQRKIRLSVTGTTTNPVTHPEKLVDDLLAEFERDLPSLLQKIGTSLLKEGGLNNILDQLDKKDADPIKDILKQFR